MADQVSRLEQVDQDHDDAAPRSGNAAQSYVRELAPKDGAAAQSVAPLPASSGFRVPRPDSTKPAVSVKPLPSVVPPLSAPKDSAPKVSAPKVSAPKDSAAKDSAAGAGENSVAAQSATPAAGAEALGSGADASSATPGFGKELELEELIHLAREFEHPVPELPVGDLWPRHENTDNLLVEPLSPSINRASTSHLIELPAESTEPPMSLAVTELVGDRPATLPPLSAGLRGTGDRSLVALRWRVGSGSFLVGCVLAAAVMIGASGEEASLAVSAVEPPARTGVVVQSNGMVPSEPARETEPVKARAANIALAPSTEAAGETPLRQQAEQAPPSAARAAVSFEDLPSATAHKSTADQSVRGEAPARSEKQTAASTSVVAAPTAKSNSESQAVQPAMLAVNSIPISTVFIDGESVGRTPRTKVKVKPGRHNVVFIHPEQGRRVVSVTLAPGQKRVVSVRF